MSPEEFLASITSEILSPDESFDVARVRQRLATLNNEIRALQQAGSAEQLIPLCETPGGQNLVALAFGLTLAARRALGPRDSADLLWNWKEAFADADLSAVLLGLLAAESNRSRPIKRRARFDQVVEKLLRDGIATTGLPLRLQKEGRVRIGGTRRLFDFVIADENGPLVAVVHRFVTTTGGRQESDIAGLVSVQASLAEADVVMLVIADGPAFKQMPALVARTVPLLHHITTLAQPDSIAVIRRSIEHALRAREGQEPLSSNDIDERIIHAVEEQLLRGVPVTHESLAVPHAIAERAITALLARHPEYDVAHATAAFVVAEFGDDIRKLHAAEWFDDPDWSLAHAIGKRLGARVTRFEETPTMRFSAIHLNYNRLRFPDALPLFEFKRSTSTNRPVLFAEIDRLLTEGPAPSRFALVFDPIMPWNSRQLASGIRGRTQLAVLDREDTAEILLRDGIASRERFLHTLLRVIDIRLVSPFVAEGPTPMEMFFGRAPEVRRIAEHIDKQSFALVGGRKVGKTSILRHLSRVLPPRIPVTYIDCQAMPDRHEFLRRLDLLVHQGTTGESAEEILEAFCERSFSGEFGVLLLDEVDELFRSDSVAGEHPHLLSNSLRSLSQRRRASIVVTGERQLYSLTGDASSPHWNFCTPIIIGGLEDQAAQDLLRSPLEDLGLSIEDDAVSLAVDECVNHPNLLQYVGYELVASLQNDSSQPVSYETVITTTDVRAIVSSPAFRERFIDTFWSRATPLEKLVSVMLASASGPKTELSLLEGLPASVSASEVKGALRFLVLYQIARQSAGGWTLSNPVFARNFLHLRTTGLLEQWRNSL